METIDGVNRTDKRKMAEIKTRGNSNMEAEDIVADAIKLNVDDDLNEQREEHYDEQYEEDANDEYYEEQDTYDQNDEEEPNYEEDELMDDEEQHEEDYEEVVEEDLNDNAEDVDDSREEELDGNEHIINQNERLSKEQQAINGELTQSADDGHKSEHKEILDTGRSPSAKKQSSSSSASKSTDKSKASSTTKSSSKDSKKSDFNKSSSDAKSSSKSKSSSKEKPKDSKDSKDSKSSDRKNTTDNDRVLWVSGLTSNVRASDLQSLFKKHGTVVGAKIIKNTRIPGSRFYGLITMETVEQAQNCIKNLHNATLDGRSITVEKNRLSERQQNTIHRERRDANAENRGRKDDSREGRRRDRSPRRRSRSPPRRFARTYGGGRRAGHFSGRGRGGPMGSRGGFVSSHSNPYFNRKQESDRMMNRREFGRDQERRRSDFEVRRQRDLERRQFEEREKLEREKLRLKLERERLEREKAEFLRLEREKARLERERIEREREELRRKATQTLPSHRSSGPSSSTKRSYEDSFGWEERKRFSGSSSTMIANSRTPYVDASASSSHFTGLSARATEDEFDRRKLDSFSSLTRTSSDFDSRRSGHDRDERRGTTSNGSSLGFMRDSLRSSLTAERSSERGRTSLGIRDHRSSSDWKSSDRRDSRFIEKNVSSSTGNGFGIVNSRSSFGGSENRPDWTASDRLASASSLSKLSYGPAVAESTERPRMIQIPIERNDSLLYNSVSSVDPNQDSYSSLNSVYRRY